MTIDGRKCISDMRDLNAAIRNNATQAFRAALDAAELDAKSTTLYRDRSGIGNTNEQTTGLRANTKADTSQVAELKGTVGAYTKYAVYVENGTVPHRIEPRNASALRFVSNGQVRFSAGVNHPGTAERPFMNHARNVGEQTLEYGLEYYVDAAIKRAG